MRLPLGALLADLRNVLVFEGESRTYFWLGSLMELNTGMNMELNTGIYLVCFFPFEEP